MNGKIAPKSNVVEDADLISQWGRQYSIMRDGDVLEASGFVPPACNQRILREQGIFTRFRRKPVGPNKSIRRGRSDDMVEVRLADITLRSGDRLHGKRPAEDELFVGNMGSIQWEIRSSMQREN